MTTSAPNHTINQGERKVQLLCILPSKSLQDARVCRLVRADLANAPRYTGLCYIRRCLGGMLYVELVFHETILRRAILLEWRERG